MRCSARCRMPDAGANGSFTTGKTVIRPDLRHSVDGRLSGRLVLGPRSARLRPAGDGELRAVYLGDIGRPFDSYAGQEVLGPARSPMPEVSRKEPERQGHPGDGQG